MGFVARASGCIRSPFLVEILAEVGPVRPNAHHWLLLPTLVHVLVRGARLLRITAAAHVLMILILSIRGPLGRARGHSEVLRALAAARLRLGHSVASLLRLRGNHIAEIGLTLRKFLLMLHVGSRLGHLLLRSRGEQEFGIANVLL